MATRNDPTKFTALVEAAEAAGAAALAAAKPTPMIVGTPTALFGNNIDPNKPVYFVEGGVCGFAWVEFAGNTAFGKWMAKTKKARPAYPKGLMVWVRDGQQSMERKEAYAAAYAKTLQAAGVNAYAMSRMD